MYTKFLCGGGVLGQSNEDSSSSSSSSNLVGVDINSGLNGIWLTWSTNGGSGSGDLILGQANPHRHLHWNNLQWEDPQYLTYHHGALILGQLTAQHHLHWDNLNVRIHCTISNISSWSLDSWPANPHPHPHWNNLQCEDPQYLTYHHHLMSNYWPYWDHQTLQKICRYRQCPLQ